MTLMTPAEQARLDQMAATIGSGLDLLIERQRELAAEVGDPLQASAMICVEIADGKAPREVAALLAIALVRLVGGAP